MPERLPLSFFLEMEKLELLTQSSMIARFGFFNLLEMGVELFLGRPGGAVNPLELRIITISAPIGPGDFHEFKGFPDFPCARQMRPEAQIKPFALLIHRQDFILWQVFDQLFALSLIGRDASTSLPSSLAARTCLARPFEIFFATCMAVTPASYSRVAPSGNVKVTMVNHPNVSLSTRPHAKGHI